MHDRREAILSRLLAVCKQIPGIAIVKRNEPVSDDWKYPALLVLDGDEEKRGPDHRPGRPAKAPRYMVMSPQIAILLGDLPENVGTELNKFRMRVLDAVLGDAKLIELTGNDPNGDIDYLGCATALARGRDLIGDMGLDFAFGYVIKPADL